MNDYETAAVECTDLEPRDVRALTDYMIVYEDAPDLFLVYGEDGDEYTVDADTGACTCPDAEYRHPEGGCKHARRVAFHTGARDVPEWADRDAMDPLLVERLEGFSRGVAPARDGATKVATDGGQIVTGTSEADGDDTDGHRAVPPYTYEPRGFYTDANYDDNFQAGRGRE